MCVCVVGECVDPGLREKQHSDGLACFPLSQAGDSASRIIWLWCDDHMGIVGNTQLVLYGLSGRFQDL